MRVHNRLLATASHAGASQHFRPAPMAILPPLQLYRRLLRAHRKILPPDMRLLGDEYVKSEFRAHKDIDNPVQIIGFLSEWQKYAQQLEGDTWRGEKMDKTKVDKMSDQQIGQLYELMKAIRQQELDEIEAEKKQDS